VLNDQGTTISVHPTTALRSVLNVAALLRLAADRGVPASRCLRYTGIDVALLEHADAEISGDQEFAVIRNLVNETGRAPFLGLEAGRRIPLTAYGILGLGVMSSATAREAVNFAIQHRELILTLADPTAEERADVFTTTWNYGRLSPSVERFLFERDATVYIALLRERLRLNVRPIHVTCTFPAPAHAEAYVEHFGVKPIFAQPANTIVHRSSDMDLPLPEASRPTAQLCHRMCDELIARRRGRSSLTAHTRFLLAQSPGTLLSQDEVASDMHMSTRTLRRRLAEEGAQFRDLLDEVRIEQATQRLLAGMTVSQVANQLGYSEPSVFIRAFKNWTGSSPGEYVRAMLGRSRD
jgi:AraC-like DNA-binding protein